MSDFISANLPYVLSGISVGGQYALIAIGYTMVYGILRLINFAHGDVFMVAGLVMVYISAVLPLYTVKLPENSVLLRSASTISAFLISWFFMSISSPYIKPIPLYQVNFCI